MMRFVFVAAALTTLAGTCAQAQDQAVSGSVGAPDGQAVSGYPIVIIGEKQHQFFAVTDAAGNFMLQGVPPGKYVAMPTGDAAQQLEFEVPSGGSTDLGRIVLPQQYK